MPSSVVPKIARALMRHFIVGLALASVLASSSLLASSRVPGGSSTILSQCRQLSTRDDDIHNCLDNHLDAMDDNLESILDVVRSELAQRGGRETSLQALENSQRAFETFRTENCLWYLAFSSPRTEAEQIAKNCLATMSEQRLSELQQLLVATDEPASSHGYYVYGTNRNTFVPCGSDKRFWVQGENSVVGGLQQRYLNEATLENQLLYVEFAGEFEAESGSGSVEAHDGLYNLQSVTVMRAPTDTDCASPLAVQQRSLDALDEDSTQEATANSEPDGAPQALSQQEQSPQNQQPEQSLIAYFSDWTASCEQLGSSYGCALSVLLQSEDDSGVKEGGLLRITRRSEQRTIVDIELPDPFVDSVSDVDQIEWRVDATELGKLLHSQLSQVEGTAERKGRVFLRQALRERWFIRDHLMPVLFKGNELVLAVKSPGQPTLELKASLAGLTRAINFADDFTAAEGQF